MITKEELFCGGRWVAPETERVIEVISPSTEEVVARVPEAREADVDRAVAEARDAFDSGPWRWMPAPERAEYLTRFADEITARVDELAQLVTLENGSPPPAARGQAMGATAVLRYYASLADTYPFSERCVGLARTSWLLREPVGVVAAIVPWNGPTYLAVSKLAPALLAGCSVIVKPAPETPVDSYVLAEACAAAGIPDGVVSILPASREVGQHLIAHPGVDKVAFTGSTAAGRKIMATCAERVARVTLELGGKSAGILLDDVDLEQALPPLLRGATLLSGQTCALLSRILVPRPRHDEIVAAMCEGLSSMKIGDPSDEQTVLGPLVAERQRTRVEGYIALGQEEGAKLVLGGGRPPDLPKGWYVEPTVFVNVDNKMRIAQEEIFGPVISVIAYDGVDDAVRIANDSMYGLAGSVFTSDLDRGADLARRVRVGTFTINGTGLDPAIPFGGFKQSGIGREGGPDGLSSYLETKVLNVPEGYEPT